jgi:hypothetical protein
MMASMDEEILMVAICIQYFMYNTNRSTSYLHNASCPNHPAFRHFNTFLPSICQPTDHPKMELPNDEVYLHTSDMENP